MASNYLLSEIFEAVVENSWMTEKAANNLIAFIRKIALAVMENAVYRLSPNPKDNYLFNLALQNNCLIIVTDDSVLLRFDLKPVLVYISG